MKPRQAVSAFNLMLSRSVTRALGLAISAILCFGMMHTACGLNSFNPTLTSTLGGLTLDQLKLIQNDERLTDAEKRDQIRAAVDAPNTPEGDRLVDFLLTMTIQ